MLPTSANVPDKACVLCEGWHASDSSDRPVKQRESASSLQLQATLLRPDHDSTTTALTLIVSTIKI